MKNILILLFIINSTYGSAQSDYKFTRKDSTYNFSKATNIIKYNSIKNLTSVKINTYITPSTDLVGRWFDFNDKNLRGEHLISHCPVFVDENDIILEFGIFRKSGHIAIFGANFKNLKKNYIKYIRKKSILVSTKVAVENKVYVYKIKMPYRDNDKEFFTSYHLIGKKGDFIHRMIIYNIDETNYENFDAFLINTFNLN